VTGSSYCYTLLGPSFTVLSTEFMCSISLIRLLISPAKRMLVRYVNRFDVCILCGETWSEGHKDYPSLFMPAM